MTRESLRQLPKKLRKAITGDLKELDRRIKERIERARSRRDQIQEDPSHFEFSHEDYDIDRN